MHTLLQSLEIEQVETSRSRPRWPKPRAGSRRATALPSPIRAGAIIIDDAKSFFSTHNRRYDIIVSEPSNPWVSGVSSLFTEEFYRRIRTHLNPGGILVQWFQLYEIDTSLVASMLGALGGTFRHYAVFAPSDHDLLVVASETALALPLAAKAFEHPGLTREFFNVHVLSEGDLDARYIGSRETLEPLFLTYGMRPNSDYFPVLDLNAARNRFTEKSAVDVVGLANLPVPVLEMLEPHRGHRPINPLFYGAADFERIENARIANYIRDYLVSDNPPGARGISSQLQKDLEVVKLRLIDCRSAREEDVWLHSLWRLAANMNPSLPPEQAGMVWKRVMDVPCYAGLEKYQRQWIELFRAVGARDAVPMAELAGQLLAGTSELNAESREYLWMAGLAGYLAAGDKAGALRLWELYAAHLAKSAPKAAFRLLRCHAQAGDSVTRAAGCAAEFAEFSPEGNFLFWKVTDRRVRLQPTFRLNVHGSQRMRRGSCARTACNCDSSSRMRSRKDSASASAFASSSKSLRRRPAERMVTTQRALKVHCAREGSAGARAPHSTSSRTIATGRPDRAASSSSVTSVCSVIHAPSSGSWAGSVAIGDLRLEMAARVELRTRRKLREQFALALGERWRHDDLRDREEIAGIALRPRQAALRQAQLLPGERARRDLEVDRAGQRRHRHRRAERRFPRRKRQVDVQIMPRGPEQRVRQQLDVEEQIPVAPAVETLAALAAQAQPLAVRRALRNARLESFAPRDAGGRSRRIRERSG